MKLMKGQKKETGDVVHDEYLAELTRSLSKWYWNWKEFQNPTHKRNILKRQNLNEKIIISLIENNDLETIKNFIVKWFIKISKRIFGFDRYLVQVWFYS